MAKGKAAFEYFHGSKGWYWRLRASNGEIVAVGEQYSGKAACRKGIRAVRKAVAEAVEKEVSA